MLSISKDLETLIYFKFIETEEVNSEINKLDPKKTTTWISIAMLKDNLDIFAPILTDIYYDCIRNGTFVVELKHITNFQVNL